MLDVSESRPYRIDHSALSVDRKNHINVIENFWNQAKRQNEKIQRYPPRPFSPVFTQV
jgi:transposase